MRELREHNKPPTLFALLSIAGAADLDRSVLLPPQDSLTDLHTLASHCAERLAANVNKST
jgi:hypothetical protein